MEGGGGDLDLVAAGGQRLGDRHRHVAAICQSPITTRRPRLAPASTSRAVKDAGQIGTGQVGACIHRAGGDDHGIGAGRQHGLRGEIAVQPDHVPLRRAWRSSQVTICR